MASKPASKMRNEACTGAISTENLPWPEPCGLSNRAHSAGLSVSETNSEIAVADAMVTANCR